MGLFDITWWSTTAIMGGLYYGCDDLWDQCSHIYVHFVCLVRTT